VGINILLSNPIWLSFSPETVRKRFGFLKSRGFPPGGHYYLFMPKSRFLGYFGVDAFMECHPDTSEHDLQVLINKAKEFKMHRKMRSWK
jgi:hypothetical protein